MSEENKTVAEEIRERIRKYTSTSLSFTQQGSELAELIKAASQKNRITETEATELEINILKTIKYSLQEHGKIMDALSGGGFEYSTAINKLTTKR